jgi:hypothetical protein
MTRADPFRQFQYPTSPEGVSDDFRNRILVAAMRGRHAELWAAS